MSGYTADVIAQRGVLADDIHFIAKPFSRDELAHKLHAILNRDTIPHAVGSVHHALAETT